MAASYLKNHPDASARDLANEIGIALGRVSKLAAWRAEMGRREGARSGRVASIKTRPLTDNMLECRGVIDSPLELAIEREELEQMMGEQRKDAKRDGIPLGNP